MASDPTNSNEGYQYHTILSIFAPPVVDSYSKYGVGGAASLYLGKCPRTTPVAGYGSFGCLCDGRGPNLP